MRAWGSPDKYIQGQGIISDLGKYIAQFGKKIGIIIDPIFIEEYQPIINKTVSDNISDATIQFFEFNNQITKKSIAEVSEKFNTFLPELIVAIGGGKVLDVGKVISDDLAVSLIICPTVASTDAPTSGMSILYDEQGAFAEIVLHDKNPNLVLVDSAIISKAPLRFFVSGIGDALSTYFEAKANRKLRHSNYILSNYGNFEGTIAGYAIAKECYQTIVASALLAKESLEKNILNHHVEDVIEANILLSGLGFENVGCSIAHGIGNAMASLPEGETNLHGERVAFGTICQLIADEYPIEAIIDVVQLCYQIGLPISLNDLGIQENEDNIFKIAEVALQATSMEVNPKQLTVSDVVSIIKTASTIGENYQLKIIGE